MKIGGATVITTFHDGCQRPPGRRRLIASSGTNAPSSSIVFEPVPRMPSVSQSSCTRTPSARSESGKCSTSAPRSGSL